MDEQRPHTKRQTWMVIGVLACIALPLLGWGIYRLSTARPPDAEQKPAAASEPDWDAFEGFGHRGSISGSGPDGVVAVKCPFWSKGNRLVLSGYSEFPGRARGPAYLVLLRLATTTDSEFAGGTRTEGGNTSVEQVFSDRGNKPFQIKYTLTKKPILEQFVLDGTPYSFDAGRVFLVDLREGPVKVTQIKEELLGLLLGRDAEKDDLRDVVGKLQERYESVRSLWQVK